MEVIIINTREQGGSYKHVIILLKTVNLRKKIKCQRPSANLQTNTHEMLYYNLVWAWKRMTKTFGQWSSRNTSSSQKGKIYFSMVTELSDHDRNIFFVHASSPLVRFQCPQISIQICVVLRLHSAATSAAGEINHPKSSSRPYLPVKWRAAYLTS